MRKVSSGHRIADSGADLVRFELNGHVLGETIYSCFPGTIRDVEGVSDPAERADHGYERRRGRVCRWWVSEHDRHCTRAGDVVRAQADCVHRIPDLAMAWPVPQSRALLRKCDG